MRANWLFGFICGCLLLGKLSADIVDVTVENERQQYLLFEPLMLRISIQNNSGQDLVFEDSGNGRSWLDFIVSNNSTKALMKRDHPASFNKLLLGAGQSRSLVVNVIPLYSIRESGSYEIQTVVQVGGREFVSSPVGVTIINGHTIWTDKRTADGSLLTYSLLRFTPTPESTFIYLRVENEAENLVYATERLGEIISFTEPSINFDNEGNLHLLYVGGRGIYRYIRTSPKGELQAKDTFLSVNDSQPQLFATKDGSVLVQGGRKEDATTRREMLSEAQALIKKAPDKPLPTTSSPSAMPPNQPSAAAN